MVKYKRGTPVIIWVFMLFVLLSTTRVQAASASYDEYVVIRTAKEFDTLLRGNLSGKYRLGNNIDLSGYQYTKDSYTSSNGWNAIGTKDRPFRGELDGNGYTIRGLWIASRGDNQGLFGWLSGAEIKDLKIELSSKGIQGCGSRIGALAGNAYECTTIENVCLIGKDSVIKSNGDFVAGMVGMLDNSTISKSGVRNLSVYARAFTGGVAGGVNNKSIVKTAYAKEISISASNTKAGGFAGGLDRQSHLISCYSIDANVTAGNEYAGGLVGSAKASKIEKSCAYATVNAKIQFSGGLIGAMDGAVVENCYSQAKVSACTGAGGLIGLALNNCGTSSEVYNSYSASTVKGSERYSSGAFIACADITFKGTNYYDESLTGSLEAYGSIYKSAYCISPKGSRSSYPQGESTRIMKKQSTFCNWDFQRIWKIDENCTYPYFCDWGWWDKDDCDKEPEVSKICVTFDPNAEDTTGTMTPQMMERDRASALNPNQYTREGYTFLGWSTSPDGAVAYADGETVRFLEDTTLYAVWQKQSITITFDRNAEDATGNMTPQEIEKDQSTPLNKNQYSRTDYAFLGWSTSPEGAVVYTDGEAVDFSEDTTLYAVWGTFNLRYSAFTDKDVAYEDDIIQYISFLRNVDIGNTTPCYNATVSIVMNDVVAFVPNTIVAPGSKNTYYDSETHTVFIEYDQIAPGQECMILFSSQVVEGKGGQDAKFEFWAEGYPAPLGIRAEQLRSNAKLLGTKSVKVVER